MLAGLPARPAAQLCLECRRQGREPPRTLKDSLRYAGARFLRNTLDLASGSETGNQAAQSLRQHLLFHPARRDAVAV